MNKSISKTINWSIALNSFSNTFHLRITWISYLLQNKFPKLTVLHTIWLSCNIIGMNIFCKTFEPQTDIYRQTSCQFSHNVKVTDFYTTYWSNRPASAYARKPHINTNKISVTRKIKSRRIAIIMIVTKVWI